MNTQLTLVPADQIVIRQAPSKVQLVVEIEEMLAEIAEIVKRVASHHSMVSNARIRPDAANTNARIRPDAANTLDVIFNDTFRMFTNEGDVRYAASTCALPRCKPDKCYAVTDDGVLLYRRDSGFTPTAIKSHASRLSVGEIFPIRADIAHILAYMQQEVFLLTL